MGETAAILCDGGIVVVDVRFTLDEMWNFALLPRVCVHCFSSGTTVETLTDKIVNKEK